MEEKEDKKAEYLKREEIRTMQKDIARLREIEAQKERERVAALKPEEKPKVPPPQPPPSEKIPEVRPPEKVAEAVPHLPPRPAPQVSAIEEPVLAPLIPKPLPKKLAPLEKILIRGLIVLICLFLVGFLCWFFEVRPPTKEEVIPPIEEEVVPPVEEVAKEPEIIIPPALIPVEAFETLEISALEEIPQLLSTLLEKALPEDQFTRILIKDIKENKILGLKEFFEAFEVEPPDNFYDRLNNDFTLFVYSFQGMSRLGFVAKIVEKDDTLPPPYLADLLNSWEQTMEKDFEKLLLTLGKEGQASVPNFRSASYKGVAFRYLSIPPGNFGICWVIAENYFIFTTSGQSIIKTIDRIYGQ